MIMKATRIGFMVLGIVVLMFVIAPYVSAAAISGQWFKGKASLKGYEIDNITSGGIVGKAGGSTTIYVNIVEDGDEYNVTTCIGDFDVAGVWNLGEQTSIPKNDIHGDSNTVMIWDFVNDSEMNFYENVHTRPMFYVKLNGSSTKLATSANFKSFACILYDDSEPPGRQLGSCSITFKNIDSAKVPRGTTGCIITP
jgi:hypothetical protein